MRNRYPAAHANTDDKTIGHIIITITGSGDSKTSLFKKLILNHKAHPIISAKMQKMYSDRRKGADYCFVSSDYWRKKAQIGFMESDGNSYVLSNDDIMKALHEYPVSVVIVDQFGAAIMKEMFPDRVFNLYIEVPTDRIDDQKKTNVGAQEIDVPNRLLLASSYDCVLRNDSTMSQLYNNFLNYVVAAQYACKRKRGESSMISIGLTGAGGVGKGTLGNALSKALGVRFIRSSVQDVGKTLYPSSKNFASLIPSDAYMFQYCAVIAQMEVEKAFKAERESFISERSVLDFIPYFLKMFEEDDDMCYSYQQIIWRYLQDNPYDYLIHVPIEFTPSADDIQKNGWKERDESSRRYTEAIINGLIDTLKFQKAQSPKIICVSGTVEERMQQCLDAIKRG